MPYSKEELKIKNKEYYLKNKDKIIKQTAERNLKNKDKISERNKKYWAENKKTLLIKNKKYYEANKESIKEKDKIRRVVYNKTPKEIKRQTIKRWKGFGIICTDFDSLYCHYLNAEECENCGIEFGDFGSLGGTWKTCDHNHVTGEFRNFLCHRCNILRGK